MAVKGLSAHKKRLALMASGMSKASARELLNAAQIVADDAKQSIIAGSVSGPGHVPSRPGEPPNQDTGVLARGIITKVNPSGKTVSVVSTARYSAALEFGTSKMIERPFLRPALRRNRNRLVQGQVQAVRSVVRAYKGG